MKTTEEARRLLDEHATASLRRSPLDGSRRTDAYHELRSHVHEAARERALAAGAPAIDVEHVEAAIAATRGAGPGIAGRGWSLRPPRTLRGRLSLAAASTATLLVVLHALTGACTDRAGCIPPTFSAVLLVAGLAGTVGAWAEVRWPPLTAAGILAATLLLSESASPLVVPATLLFVASGAAVHRRPTPRAPRPPPESRRVRNLAWFLLVGAALPWITETVVDETLGLHTEGGAQEVGLPVALAAALAVALAWATGQRSPGLIAAAVAVAVAGVVLGFLVLFAWGAMPAGSDAVRP